MMRRTLISFFFIICFLLASPILIYHWGLSQLDSKPQASTLRLTSQQQYQIWHSLEHTYSEGSKPSLKKMNPYIAIKHYYCVIRDFENRQKCHDIDPGFALASFAVRPQIHQALFTGVSDNTQWQVTWFSYSIWVTRNWSLEEVLATYNQTYSVVDVNQD